MRCELCDHEMEGGRRSRDAETGKLLCWNCTYELGRIRAGETLDHIARTSREFHECNSLRDEVSDLRDKLTPLRTDKKQYPYNNAVSAAPSREVLKRSILALDLTHSFTEFSIVLGDHYGFSAPPYYANDEQVKSASPTAIACYTPNTNTVYALEKRPLSHYTAFHEFWHALEAHGYVAITKDREKNADLYADACLRVLQEN